MASLRPLLRRSALTFHTLRHLPARQLGHLVWARWVPRRFRSTPRLPRVIHLNRGFSFRTPPLAGHQCFCTAEGLAANRFAFLNREVHFGSQVRWSDPALPMLWRYNLHYFDYLWRAPWPEAQRLMLDWIQANPPAASPGWDPYPLSVRAMNWIVLLGGRFQPSLARAAPGTRRAILRSLFQQGAYLCRHLEKHLDGNHLFKNAAALFLLGSFFQGRRAEQWRSTAYAMLWGMARRQFLPDGGHFERSPMYHALCLLDLLHVINAAGPHTATAGLEQAAARAAAFLSAMVDRRGQLLLLNDSARNVAPPVPDVLRYARRVLQADLPHAPPAGAVFPHTGYAVCRDGDDHLVVDAGEVGPDRQPGHAHGDIFSFELMLDGRPVIVDSGVCDYEPGPTRAYVRSTAAHNTVELDGQDQCEFWAAFRVARRGRPRQVRFAARTGGLGVRGWHDGYQRLAGRPSHRRELAWRHGVLTVQDWVRGRADVAIASRLHLHPDCSVHKCGDREAVVCYGSGHARVVFSGRGRLAVEEGWYCPEFGRKLRNRVLTFRSTGSCWRGGFRIGKGGQPLPSI